MESQRIKILLKKYFDAENTLSEENELINHFNSGRVDEGLKQYQPLFSGLKELSAAEYPGLGDDLMNYILESEHKEKLRYRWISGIVATVAASVILAMLAVNFYSNPKPSNVIISDPDQAYEEVSNAFKYLAGKYEEGIAELAPLKNINDAADPLHSGISTINEGFNEMKEIKRINNEFKNK